jgi:hypothetical protein
MRTTAQKVSDALRLAAQYLHKDSIAYSAVLDAQKALSSESMLQEALEIEIESMNTEAAVSGLPVDSFRMNMLQQTLKNL